MRKRPFISFLVYSFFLICGSAHGIGEKILGLGGASSWEAFESRRGITEAAGVRPHPVLLLAGGESRGGEAALGPENFPAGNAFPENASRLIDLHLSFDESRPESFGDSRGRYDVFVSPGLAAAAAPLSRFGTGAALFTAAPGTAAPPLTLKPRGTALFSPGSRVRDFSVEFWLYPLNLENGEQILSWNSSLPGEGGAYLNQRLECVISKNRLEWFFGDFFFSPDEKNQKSSIFSGSPLLPRAWSHHLIRFNADTGLLEYLVDGRLEALDYLTSSGREGGEVFTPLIGEDCGLTLGGRFTGMMDEFRVYGGVLENPVLAKYPQGGGRIESRTMDLGGTNSRVLMIEAFGGRTSNNAGRSRNEYSGNASLRFSDHGEIRLFVRAGDSPFRWNGVPWIPVEPGTELPDTLRGRYVQIAADFYPGWDGETSPYLSEIRIVYHAAEAPPPPVQVFAAAKDGAVELSWRASPSRDVGGYLVYYGTARGEYFGDSAILESGGRAVSSPIDAGNRTRLRIEGLNNGTLYFFTVAAYGAPGGMPGFVPEPGEFSREVAARPLRMAE